MTSGIYDRAKAKPNKGMFKKGHIPQHKGKKRVPRPIMSKKCKSCKKTFYRQKRRSDQFWKNQKFCNRRCWNEYKNKFSVMPCGKKHWAWKGGRHLNNGYIIIHKPKHRFCSERGYVFEHRLVVEAQIGRYLLPNENTHHLNEIKQDNRPENLMAFTSNSAHMRFHNGDHVKPEEIIFDGRKIK